MGLTPTQNYAILPTVIAQSLHQTPGRPHHKAVPRLTDSHGQAGAQTPKNCINPPNRINMQPWGQTPKTGRRFLQRALGSPHVPFQIFSLPDGCPQGCPHGVYILAGFGCIMMHDAGGLCNHA